VSRGRLKLRTIDSLHSELIFYERPTKKGNRYSRYIILPVEDAAYADTLFTAAFGRLVVVEKRRRLYLYKNARIHVDNVKRLGTFLEFEVLVLHGAAQARTLLKFLVETFCIDLAKTYPGSYADLLRTKK
jgi:adenylate cyclase class IV